VLKSFMRALFLLKRMPCINNESSMKLLSISFDKQVTHLLLKHIGVEHGVFFLINTTILIGSSINKLYLNNSELLYISAKSTPAANSSAVLVTSNIQVAGL
jgi:hypothetical protein